MQVAPDARSEKPKAELAQNDPPGEAKLSKKDKTPKDRRGTIWLKDGEFVRPMEVKLGASDGSNTAVIADALQEGQEVIVGETVATAQASTKNPFIPQMPRR
jgi:hypothetical protein